MEDLPRHQCLLYVGSPAQYLPALAAALRDRLRDGYRCLYLNSPPMVAGIRPYLMAAGVDVGREEATGALVLSADRQHLVDGTFDLDGMIGLLEDAVAQAARDGYAGLFATGDMAWEFGAEQNFAKLVDYERRLDALFHKHPGLSGICQYQRDVLPLDAVRTGLLAHPTVFINETLSRMNPHYLPRGGAPMIPVQELDGAVAALYRPSDE